MIEQIKILYKKLLLSRGSPKEIAGGVALGALIAFTPPPALGFHTLIGVSLALLLKRNRLAAILGCWINNPFTILPIYLSAYHLGLKILHRQGTSLLAADSLKDWLQAGTSMLLPLWIGGLLLGSLVAIISYSIVLWVYPRLPFIDDNQDRK